MQLQRADDRVSVLVVDDSVLYRKVLSQILEEIRGVQVVATASNGRLALRRIELQRPDLVILDVEMPVMGGLETLKELKRRRVDVPVIMVSGNGSADVTMEAIALGALDFVEKPSARNPLAARDSLLTALRPVIEDYIQRRRRTQGGAQRAQPSGPRVSRSAPRRAPAGRPRIVPARISLLAIGISTGGPSALNQLIPSLARGLRLPVVLVQHMPAGFTRSLAAQLDRRASVEVKEAEPGDALRPGRVLVAPGGRHMVVRRANGELQISLNGDAPVKACRPSVDVLFSSLAGLTRRPVLSVILTGMGDDGADGVELLRRHGGYNLAQDEESCVVYGMPRAVAERGLADEVLPLERIALRINELSRRADNER